MANGDGAMVEVVNTIRQEFADIPDDDVIAGDGIAVFLGDDRTTDEIMSFVASSKSQLMDASALDLRPGMTGVMISIEPVAPADMRESLEALFGKELLDEIDAEIAEEVDDDDDDDDDDESVQEEEVDYDAVVEKVLAAKDVEGIRDIVGEITKKVVRGGKVVKVKVRRGRKKKLSSKQKAALKKARRKASTPAAKKKRAKSAKVRKARGL